jgi:hypothetical protein
MGEKSNEEVPHNSITKLEIMSMNVCLHQAVIQDKEPYCLDQLLSCMADILCTWLFPKHLEKKSFEECLRELARTPSEQRNCERQDGT